MNKTDFISRMLNRDFTREGAEALYDFLEDVHRRVGGVDFNPATTSWEWNEYEDAKDAAWFTFAHAADEDDDEACEWLYRQPGIYVIPADNGRVVVAIP